MAMLKLDELPKELIAHIASSGDAYSALNLSTTCHRIRAACYDNLVFKAILITSQQTNWSDNPNSLDIDAICTRAGNDTTTWARYALADKRAWNFARNDYGLISPKNFINFLPELFVVKHPFICDEAWKAVLRYRMDQKPSQLFCMALTIIAADESMPEMLKSLYLEGGRHMSIGDSAGAFLWAFCTIALTARTALRTRLAAWPYNNAAIVPYMSLPKAFQIPLRPMCDSYSLPAPFSRRAVELLGAPTTSFGNWDSWYRLHNFEQFRSNAYWTDSTWCGYYMRPETPPRVDPPMSNIQFRFMSGAGGNAAPCEDSILKVVIAEDCLDGLDEFELRLTIICDEDSVKLSGRKQYKTSDVGWDWDCRLTPFGIVGFWGTRTVNQYRVQREGMLWLWKKAWTE